MTYVSQMTDLSELSAHDIDSYLEHRSSIGLSRTTLHLVASRIRGYIRFAAKNGYCKDIASSIRSPLTYALSNLPSAPSWNIVKRLVSFYWTDDNRGRRNTAIMSMLAVYGQRTSEIVNLRLHDIDWGEDTIIIGRAKRSGLQILPLVPVVGNYLSN